jgi:hypothetical protein
MKGHSPLVRISTQSSIYTAVPQLEDQFDNSRLLTTSNLNMNEPIEPNSAKPRIISEEELRYAQQGAFTNHLPIKPSKQSLPSSHAVVRTLQLQNEGRLGDVIFFDPSCPIIHTFKSQLAPVVELKSTVEEQADQSHEKILPVAAEIMAKEYFSAEIEEKKGIIALSRFIHHSINFKGIKRITALFASMYVLLMVSVLIVYLWESSVVSRFMRVAVDLEILDVHHQLLQSCNRAVLDMDIGRMVKQGALLDDSFSAYGIKSIKDKYLQEGEKGNTTNSLYVSLMSLLKHYGESEFKNFHDIQEFVTTPISILKEDNDFKSISIATLTSFEATRFVQYKISEFAKKSWESKYSTLNSLTNRLESKTEEIVRYNCLNSLGRYFSQGSPKLNLRFCK